MDVVEVDLNKCPTEKCVKCGSKFFKPRFIIKKITKEISGLPEDAFRAVHFMACERCGVAHHATTIDISGWNPNISIN